MTTEIQTTENIVEETESNAPASALPATTPAVDVYESPDGYLLVADLPGVARDDLDVEVDGNVLSIVGRRTLANEGQTLHRAFGSVEFRRSFRLPKVADIDELSAKLEAGVLTLTVPKRPESRPRRIEVAIA